MICMKQTLYQRDEVSTPSYNPTILNKASNHLYCQKNFEKHVGFLYLKIKIKLFQNVVAKYKNGIIKVQLY